MDLNTQVYTLIRGNKFEDCIKILKKLLNGRENSTVGLSLLAYCYYQSKDFFSSSSCYESLIRLLPEREDYKINYIKSLYLSDQCQKALKEIERIIVTDENINVISNLKAFVYYKNNEKFSLEKAIKRIKIEDVRHLNNQGCLYFVKENYLKAIEFFENASSHSPKNFKYSYNIALCHYRLGSHEEAIKCIDEILERIYEKHPEYKNMTNLSGILSLKFNHEQSCLIEILNLKACIYYDQNNFLMSKTLIDSLPYTKIEEYDPVSLHNKAIIEFRESPLNCFYKLKFLFESKSLSTESMRNLIILYLNNQDYIRIDDLMKMENFDEHLADGYLKDILQIFMTSRNSPEDAYSFSESIIQKQTERVIMLRKSSQSNQRELENAKGVLLQILMQQSKILWDLGQYKSVEKILNKFSDFFHSERVWLTNLANSIFMQENRFREAISIYNQIVNENSNSKSLLKVDPMLLANLCVAYILNNENGSAEKIMKLVEAAEEIQNDGETTTTTGNGIHSCLIKLIIGTLYCVKGNYDFGINRIIKSLDPIEKCLTKDTWSYTNKAIMSMIEGLASGFLIVQQKVIKETVEFLVQCEKQSHMLRIPDNAEELNDTNTIHYEARRIRELLITLISA